MHMDFSPEVNFLSDWNYYMTQKCFCLIFRKRDWKVEKYLFVQINNVKVFSACCLYKCRVVYMNSILLSSLQGNLTFWAKYIGNKYCYILQLNLEDTQISSECKGAFVSFSFPLPLSPSSFLSRTFHSLLLFFSFPTIQADPCLVQTHKYFWLNQIIGWTQINLSNNHVDRQFIISFWIEI